MAKQYDKIAIKMFADQAMKAGRIPDGKYTIPSLLKRFGLINGDCLNNAGEVLFGSTHPVTLKTAIFATDEKLTFLDMKLAEYNTNTNHEICIYPGKITIYSPGSYASSFKPEDYIKKSIPSVIRNAIISKTLYLNKSIEQFGSGFKRIDSLCKDAGVQYSYENTELGFTFILYRKNLNYVTVNDTQNVTVNQTEQAVLSLLQLHPKYTREQLADATSKTVRTMQRVLNTLREKNLLERKGSDKDGYWVVKM